MEKIPAPIKNEQSQEYAVPVEAVDRLPIENNALIDAVKKLSYPFILIGSFVLGASHESAHAVEIPVKATYEEGVALLHEAALEEGRETAALFLKFAGGDTAWYSVEGGVLGVSLHGKDVGKADFLTGLLQRYKISAGQKVSVIHLHNHPLESAIAAGMTQGEKATTISLPPSGIGFSQYGGDAGYWNMEEYEKATNIAEERLDISITWTDKVVDPQGTWTYEKIPPVELAALGKDETFYDEYLEEQELKAQSDALDWEHNSENLEKVIELNSMRFEKMKELRKFGNAVSTLKGAWSTQSRYMSATEAVKGGFYSALVDGYKKFGIRLRFEPFPVKSK